MNQYIEANPIRNYLITWERTVLGPDGGSIESGYQLLKGFDAADVIAIFQCVRPDHRILAIEPVMPK